MYQPSIYWLRVTISYCHTLFYGPILAINKPLTMTFASANSFCCLLINSKVVVKFRYRIMDVEYVLYKC